jgi:hypothetical protein
LTGADTRGADEHLSDATAANLIRPNGTITGLNLTDGQHLLVRDYDGDSREWRLRDPISIMIHDSMTVAADGVLQLRFESDSWDSTISFEPGIPVQRGGTLELTFADDVNVAAEVGRTLKIFDWTGISPTGAFTVSSPYNWDTSKLHTTGEVTLIAVPATTGDFDNNSVVDAADYDVWRTQFGLTVADYSGADANGDGIVDAGDYVVWRNNFATVGNAASTAIPEPHAATLGLLAVVGLTFRCRMPNKSTLRPISGKYVRISQVHRRRIGVVNKHTRDHGDWLRGT